MFKMWYNILVSNGVSYCVHDFNLSKFISVWDRACRRGEPFTHTKKGPKRGKVSQRASDTYNASTSNHLNIRGTANLEAFLFDTMLYKSQRQRTMKRGRRWQKLRQEHKQIKN